VLHSKYAQDPLHYIRAANVIQNDLVSIFEYIEPDDGNLSCFSLRTAELLTRTCIEVEANLSAILRENRYVGSGREWTISDYKKIEGSHFLSRYEIEYPHWRTGRKIVSPFKAWSSGGPLGWYQDYNKSKHDRHRNFPRANFGSLIEAFSGLMVLLSAQFWTEDYSLDDHLLSSGKWPSDGFETAIGGYVRVRFTDDLTEDEKYGFDWGQIKMEEDPFRNFAYS